MYVTQTFRNLGLDLVAFILNISKYIHTREYINMGYFNIERKKETTLLFLISEFEKLVSHTQTKIDKID